MSGWVAVVSTAYCLSGTMADGTGVRPGSVANNALPLGTRVTVSAAPTQRRRFVVRDRIGWGTQLDFWVPSCARARAWGRRTVRLHRGWPSKIGRAGRSKGRLAHAHTARLRRLADLDPARGHRHPDSRQRQLRLSCWSCSSWSGWPPSPSSP